MILYGLKTCDACRKALKELGNAGCEPHFVDVRAAPPGIEKIDFFLQAFGDALVNRKSTTWRNLDDAQRLRPPAEILCEFPTLMKRPVIESKDRVTLGWTDEVRRDWGIV